MADIDANFVDDIVAIAKEFFAVVAKDLDQYTTRKNEIVVEEGSVTLLTPSHIQFAKYGRGPGKKPPLDPIEKWVKRKNVQFRDPKGRFISHKGTAFAIQAKIAREGTSNYVKGAPNALEEALQNSIEEYSRKTGNLIALRVEDEVNKIYKEVFPPKREFKI